MEGVKSLRLIDRPPLSSLVLCAALAATLVSHAGAARAATYDWDAAPNVQFRMWIPDDQPVVYGFYLVFNESATDDREYAIKQRIQTWAQTMGFGIIGTYFTDPNSTNDDTGHSDDVLAALQHFADMSGHPEIANAPVLPEGLSLGGYNAMQFAADHPERTIAYLSGASRDVIPYPSNPAFAHVPGLFYIGDMDPRLDNALARRDALIPFRQNGAQIGFFIQWGFGHEFGYADDIGWKFLSDAVSLRYPEGASPADGPVSLIDIPDEDGWLADWTTWQSDITQIAAYGDFAPGPSKGFWLPTRDFAYVYRSHATETLPVSFTQPSGPGQWDEVMPGDTVDIAVSVGTLTGVKEVDVYDGSQPIAQMTAAPYAATWTAQGIGPHMLVAVATLDDDSQRTGYTAPVMVLGTAAPGGGTPGGGGSDAGPGGGAGGDAGLGGDDGSGGCGCRTGADAGGAAPTVSLLALALLAGPLRRRRGGA